MAGYRKDFLDGVVLPMPGFSPMLEETVLKSTTLDEGIYAHYVNYSVITSKEMRSPILSALNIDQNKLKSTRRRNKWQIDSRIGADYQLNNDYYRRNPWDRGHLARRNAASWGDSTREAQRASDETFYYSNASLQHENFNQDEWLALEDWVLELALDRDGKITSFSGPVYGDFSRVLSPNRRTLAYIPSAFFKIVCFINKETRGLDVRSFIMYQDREALADKQGKRKLTNFQIYQVTVSEIEEKTGLEFDNAIYEYNPLLYRENEKAREELKIVEFPERIEVDSSTDIQDKDTPRTYVADDEIDVFIIAAMVNPHGSERDNEWVSIINLGNEVVDLDGWSLSDNKRKRLQLNTVVDEQMLRLVPGQSLVLKPVSPLQLANSGGTITLFDQQNRRIDRVKYTKSQAKTEGQPIIFGSTWEKQKAQDSKVKEAERQMVKVSFAEA